MAIRSDFASHWMPVLSYRSWVRSLSAWAIRILLQEDLDERWPVC